MTQLTLNPYIPKNAEGDLELLSSIGRIKANLYLNSPLTFADREIITAPVWVLAHSYLKSAESLANLTNSIKTTSTVQRADRENGIVEVIHQMTHGPRCGYMNNGTVYVDSSSYGMVIPVPLEKFPIQEIGLSDFITSYPEAAEAFFLMDTEARTKLAKEIQQSQHEMKLKADTNHNLGQAVITPGGQEDHLSISFSPKVKLQPDDSILIKYLR